MAQASVDEQAEGATDGLQVELVGWSAAAPGDVRRAVELVLRDAGLLKPPTEADERLSG